MIVVGVFLSILNQIEFHLVENRKENCQQNHIPFNVKGNGNIVFSLQFGRSWHYSDIYNSLLFTMRSKTHRCMESISHPRPNTAKNYRLYLARKKLYLLTGVSRHNESAIEVPFKPLGTILLWYLWGFRGPLMEPSWCREIPVHRTAWSLYYFQPGQSINETTIIALPFFRRCGHSRIYSQSLSWGERIIQYWNDLCQKKFKLSTHTVLHTLLLCIQLQYNLVRYSS